MTTNLNNLNASYTSFGFEQLVPNKEAQQLQKLLQRYASAGPAPAGSGPIYFYGDRGQLTMRAFQELAAKCICYWLASSGMPKTSVEIIHVTRSMNLGVFYSLNFKIRTEHYVLRISKEASERDFRVVIRRDLTSPFGPALPHNSAPVLLEKIARLDGVM